VRKISRREKGGETKAEEGKGGERNGKGRGITVGRKEKCQLKQKEEESRQTKKS